MELRYDNNVTYYDLTRTDFDQSIAWLDAIVVATNPEEVDADSREQLAYLKDESTMRQFGNIGIRAYFVKSVKPEFWDLGFTSEPNGNGIQVYTPPKNLQPGQYDIGYNIEIQNHHETNERYDGSYNIAFKYKEPGQKQQVFSIARPIRQPMGLDEQSLFLPLSRREYHDEFEYRLNEQDVRLYAAHRCFGTDISKGRYPFYPMIGKRAEYDSFDKQVTTISRLLHIAAPDFIETQV